MLKSPRFPEIVATDLTPAPTTGRPSDYNATVAETICVKIAGGKSLRKVCELESMPSKTSVMRWLAKHPEFRDQYRAAREIQAEIYFDELIDDAEEATPETVHVQKLKINTKQWVMGKIAPKKYGDAKTDINISNTVQNITVMSEEKRKEIQARCREALAPPKNLDADTITDRS